LGNEKNKLGKVVAVGDGYYSVTGHYIETVLNVGDTIILPTMGFSKLEHEGEEYWIGPENQVLGKLVEETNEEEYE
jgi:co-chaperonin GroES (HSP10)